MKLITIRNSEMYSLENVKSVTISKISSSKHTTYGTPYYLYSGYIAIQYFGNTITNIDLKDYENESCLKRDLQIVFDKIHEILSE